MFQGCRVFPECAKEWLIFTSYDEVYGILGVRCLYIVLKERLVFRVHLSHTLLVVSNVCEQSRRKYLFSVYTSVRTHGEKISSCREV